MRKLFYFAATVVFLLSSFVVNAAVDVVLFDRPFTRGTGAPETLTFSFPSVSGIGMVKLWNGDAADSTVERVSSSVITLNGTTVFSSSNFNQNVYYLEKPVSLNNENTISVLLKSKPGGTVKIKVVQKVEAEGAKIVDISGDTVQVTNPESPIFGAKVVIPPGAISSPQVIMIGTIDPGTVPPPQYNPPSEGISLLPDGITFAEPISITFPYRDNNNDGYVDDTGIPEEYVRVETFDRTTNEWKDIPVTFRDPIKNFVQVSTYHFSDWRAYVVDKRFVQETDSSRKFAIQRRITGAGPDYVDTDLSFMNSTSAWVQITPNYDDPNYVDFSEVYLVPPVQMVGWKVPLGNIRFHQDQYIQLDVDRNTAPVFIATAIDLIMRGVFGQRLDIGTVDTFVGPALAALSSAGNELDAMMGYIATGDMQSAAQEALGWLFSVQGDKIAHVFCNVLNLRWAYESLVSKTLDNLLQAISLPDKYFLFKEIGQGIVSAPSYGYVRLELQNAPPPVGPVNLFSVHFPNGYYAESFISDPNRLASVISVSGPGISGEAWMGWVPSPMPGWWHGFRNPFLGTYPPSSPMTYFYTVTLNNGQTIYFEKSISGYVEEFATNLKPSGNVDVRYPDIQFSWTGISNALDYWVDLYGPDNFHWRSSNVPCCSANYNGTLLMNGVDYSYDVTSRRGTSSSWNSSMARGSFRYLGGD